MSAVDLTKCQPGDLLRLRDGSDAVYVGRREDDGGFNHVSDPYETYNDKGLVYHRRESPKDIVFARPTRIAELERHRLELLEALKDAMEHVPTTLQGRARKAIARTEAHHE